jgi:hypothetical protein
MEKPAYFGRGSLRTWQLFAQHFWKSGAGLVTTAAAIVTAINNLLPRAKGTPLESVGRAIELWWPTAPWYGWVILWLALLVFVIGLRSAAQVREVELRCEAEIASARKEFDIDSIESAVARLRAKVVVHKGAKLSAAEYLRFLCESRPGGLTKEGLVRLFAGVTGFLRDGQEARREDLVDFIFPADQLEQALEADKAIEKDPHGHKEVLIKPSERGIRMWRWMTAHPVPNEARADRARSG